MLETLSKSAFMDRYLGNDFQPCVNFYSRESTSHGMANVIMVAVLEPQCEQPQGVLEGFLILQRY
jgi:hypothetical protein